MGLLSFLSRKPSSAEIQSNYYHDDVLKAQAYDATIPSMPPIRGTFPVAGNGPNILEKYQRSHPNLRSAAYSQEDSAPPPLVPRLHSSSTGRPRTASTEHGGSEMGRPRIVSAVTPSQSRLSLRPTSKKRFGSFILPTRSGHNDAAASLYSAPSPTFARARASSIRSGNGSEATSTRGFVDLLDAHSLIKPSDFHGRVQANGARNYGEDVADRNMMESAPDLAPSQARELYARTFGLDPSAIDGDSESEQSRLPRKWRSMGSGLRASSTKSSSRASKKPSRGSLQPSQSRKAEKDHWRKSLPSYMASPSDQLETDPHHFPDSLRDRARAAATRQEHRNRSPAKTDPPRKQSNSSKRGRDTGMSTRATTPRPYSHHRNDSEQTLPDREPRPKSAKRSSKRRSLSLASSLSVPKSPSKRLSLHNFPKSNIKDDTDSNQRTMEPQIPPKSTRRSASRGRLRSLSDAHDSPLQLVQPPRINSSPHRPGTSGSSHHIRNRSFVSLSTKSINAFDIEGSIPERTSSIRRWSLTSETGGSTRSSNPFRPQSGHTTNTSIDNGPVFPFSPSMTSVSVHDSRVDCAVPVPSLKATRTHSSIRSSAKSTQQQGQKHFNIDDYVSSDDSSTSPRRTRGEDEKELLFADVGYGADGFQLPGLAGMFDAAVPPSRPTQPVPQPAQPPPPRPSKPKHTTTTTKGPQTPFHMTAFTPDAADARSIGRSSQRSMRSSRSTPHEPRSRTLRLRIPALSYSDSEEDDDAANGYIQEEYPNDNDEDNDDEDEEEEICFDIPRRRPEPRRYSHGGAGASTSSRQQQQHQAPRYEAAEEPIFEGQVLDFLDALRSSHREEDGRGRSNSSSSGANHTNHSNTSTRSRTRQQQQRPATRLDALMSS